MKMTLGEKIKKYRILKGLTQKELGLAVGFSAATADSRIRKYERDLIAPKDDIRIKLAKALEVDLSAISDIDVATYEDVMQVLFLFEESYGMDIDKKDGKTVLVFDDKNESIRTLITYMNLWQGQRKALLSNQDKLTDERIKAYEVWKSRFPSNIKGYFTSKENEILEYYRHLVILAEKNCPYAKVTSDITLLLRKIVESGFTLTTTYSTAKSAKTGPGFIFVVDELLAPPSEDAAKLFAQFLSELNHFSDLGAKVYSEMQMAEKSLTITYYIPIASFSVIKDQIDELLEYRLKDKNGGINDFARDSFELKFSDDLKTYYNNIEDEIARYSDR